MIPRARFYLQRRTTFSPISPDFTFGFWVFYTNFTIHIFLFLLFSSSSVLSFGQPVQSTRPPGSRRAQKKGPDRAIARSGPMLLLTAEPFLHFLRGGDPQQVQALGDDRPGGVGQLQPGIPEGGVLHHAAAGVVEAVEAARQVHQVAVDAGGIVVPGGQADLLDRKSVV